MASSSSKGLPSARNGSSALPFWNRMHRYRVLLTKFWWILALTLSLGICIAAAYQLTRPAMYSSTATLSVDVENHTTSLPSGAATGGPFNQQGVEDFVQTQIDIIKGASVAAAAAEQLQASHPGESGPLVELDFTPRNSLLTIEATSPAPDYTQHFLQARIAGYLDFRKHLRDENAEGTIDKITVQIKDTQNALKADAEAMLTFQKDNGVVFDKSDAANGSQTTLASLNKKLADLQDEQARLRAMTPEEGFASSVGARGAGSGSAGERTNMEASPAESDYRQGTANLVKLKAELDDWSHDLRPKHPKIVAINDEIRRQQQQIDSLLAQNRTNIQNRLAVNETMIASTQKDIAAQGPKELNTNLLRAKYDTLVEQKDRDLKQLNDLQTASSTAYIHQRVDLDTVLVTGAPSAPEVVPYSWLKAMTVAILGGLLVGFGILLLIDRMDDRMGSISDFQLHFAEHVIGQIPRDPAAGNTELLRPDDERHMLVESFRNLRSTLLFMPLDGQRPKTLLVTSAIPNEGKSTVSCNLALVLAFAGMKTLLIDADLRRGAIHEAFGLTRDPGLTDVLGHGVKLENAVRTTKVENLHVLPRGRNVPQPSEYLLNKSTDRLLQDLYPEYDYIIIDSSPILAADDTASLAPKIDATLFVVRLSFTYAKMTRKSLEILYNRQANIPGLILNQVDTTSPEFVYYQYSEYYHTATDAEPTDSLAKSK